ncbi:MAG TPA: septum site-determining protein MinC, partial [Synergistaceae bacterium]|nr:septum site-determining protein MinC [Synergistaceae bacterium]
LLRGAANPGARHQGSPLRMVVHEEASLDALRQDLQRLGEEGEHIFSGAGVVVDFQERNVVFPEIALFLEHFSRKGEKGDPRILSWISNNSATLGMFKNLGFVTGVPESGISSEKERSRKSLVHDRSVRSGQSIEHSGDVIVLGNVHDGGEVVSRGNIVILGKLQGVAHAGAGGDVGASIFARVFEAPQVRLAHKVSYVDQNASWWGKAALVVLEDGIFVVQEMDI